MSAVIRGFSRLDRVNNTLVYNTSNEQWRSFYICGAFGVTRAKTWMGCYVNDGTVRGRLLLYPALLHAWGRKITRRG